MMQTLLIVLILVASHMKSNLEAQTRWSPPNISGFSTVVIEGDVIMGNELPTWGKVCADTPVYGVPGENFPILYTLKSGEVVRLHEQSRADSSWVMIKSARWIKLTSLCAVRGQ